jgi:hypothetical protein
VRGCSWPSATPHSMTAPAFPLPISGSSHDDAMDRIPANAEEYLRYVMYEAANMPAVVVAAHEGQAVEPSSSDDSTEIEEYSDPSEENLVEMMHINDNDPANVANEARDEFKPDAAWMQRVLVTFQQLRQHVCSVQDQLGNLPSKPIHARWKEILESPPSLGDVCLLTGLQKLFVLQACLESHQQSPVSPLLLSGWIYAILVAFSEPLTADEMSDIRQLGQLSRRYTQPEQWGEQTRQVKAEHATIILLVAVMFKQWDLIPASWPTVVHL